MMFLSGKIDRRILDRPGWGFMYSPGVGNRPIAGPPFACDNGCYADPDGFDLGRHLTWLERFRDLGRPLFCTLPDVWSDGAETLRRSLPVLDAYRAAGWPPALCLQDGMTVEAIPWRDLAAVFVGGSNAWRWSAGLDLVAEANRRGVWTHLGRVSSRVKIESARLAGYRSADSMALAFAFDRVARRVALGLAQPPLFRPEGGRL